MDNEIFDLTKIQIEIKLNQKATMLAQVQLKYGSLRIFGYRVMRSAYSDDNLFIQPPSVRAGSTWLWLVRVDDPSIWENLQNMIKNKYLEEVKKYNETITGAVEEGIIKSDEDVF